MQSFFGFAAPANVDIGLSNTSTRRYRDGLALGSGLPQRHYIYCAGDDIVGDVKVGVVGGKRLEHLGVKIELKGVVDISGEKGGHSHEFVSVVRELAAPGQISGLQSFPFKFAKADLPHETYDGAYAVCRYFLRATVGRTATAAHAVRELEIIVQSAAPQPDALALAAAPASSALSAAPPASASLSADSSVKLEVGIEDCLHIEFEYDATRLALDDDVTGRVHFLLVRIRIKTMELALVRRETVGAAGGGGAGSGSAGQPESETLTRFELMDGCPVRGEVIPIRMPLAGLDLTPSFAVDVAGGSSSGGAGGAAASTFFSVRYFLNLVLLDEEDRRYFKQAELFLHRSRTSLDAGAGAAGAAAPQAGGL